VNPSACLSGVWRAKYERILLMVSSDTALPLASCTALALPVSVNPEPALPSAIHTSARRAASDTDCGGVNVAIIV